MLKNPIYEDICFEDKTFPLWIRENSTSCLSGQEKNFGGFIHEQIEIKLFYEGSTLLLIDDDSVFASEGDIVIINPYEFHCNISLGDNPGKYHLFIIDLNFFNAQGLDTFDLRRMFLQNSVKFVNIIKNNTRLYNILENVMLEMSKKREQYKLVVTGLLTEFFVLVMRDFKIKYSKDILDVKIKNYQLIAPAVNFIIAQHTRRITLDELAKECNMSKYHFCRTFKKCIGMTAFQYITEYRLKKAESLMVHTEAGIAEIAHLTGFEDTAYFSRCYKKIRGVSPKAGMERLMKKTYR